MRRLGDDETKSSRERRSHRNKTEHDRRSPRDDRYDDRYDDHYGRRSRGSSREDRRPMNPRELLAAK